VIIVYHGSNVLFDHPDLGAARDRRDFGQGFYTTTLRDQADAWAKSMTDRFGGQPHVYTFGLVTSGLAIQQFNEISIDWLDMVRANRVLGGVRHEFDVVVGPVANDNTMRTVSLYVAGVYDPQEAMRRLRYFKANDQVSLHTPRAMSQLTLKDREDV
jgi:hypothetical protein